METLQITALSCSYGKVQALELTRHTQQLLHLGLLLLLLRGTDPRVICIHMSDLLPTLQICLVIQFGLVLCSLTVIPLDGK